MSWQHKPQQACHMVTANTSSSTRHGTGNAAANNGFLSSFQTPAVAGQAMPSAAYKPAINQSAASTLSTSINHEDLVVGAVRSSSLPNVRQMGHGQSKSTQPRPVPTSTSQVLDDAAATSPTTATKGNAAGGNRLKRPFVAKTQRSDGFASTTAKSKESSVEITATQMRPLPQIPPNALTSTSAESKSTSPRMRPSQQSPPSSPPTVQVLDRPLVTSPSNTSPLSPLPASPPDHPQLPPKEPISSTHSLPSPDPSLLDPPTPSNRSSVIPLSPGISSAVNFIMMEWQQQSPPKQGLDTPVAMVTLPPTSPLSCAEEPAERMTDKDNEKEKESAKRHSGGSGSTSPDRREMKESWRKSDSTNSHHTVRQNSSRASRPVSWAESFHSAYTIIPSMSGTGAPQLPSSKRLSALITDADFGLPEEEVEEDDDVDDNRADVGYAPATASLAGPNSRSSEQEAQIPPPVPHKPSKDSLSKVNRRSISLSSALPSTVVNFLVGGGHGKPPQAHPQHVLPTSILTAASASAADVRKVSHSISGFESLNMSTSQLVPQHLRQQSEVPSPLSPLRPSGISNYHAPSTTLSPSSLSPSSSCYTNLPSPSTTSSIKGKIHAFLPTLPKSEQKLPAIPGSPAGTDSYSVPPAPATPSHTSHNRQPTLSGLGPSAAGLAKRAVERMGKRWGWGDMMSGLTSSSNSSTNAGLSSGHSSTTSVSTSMTSGVSYSPPPWVDGGAVKSGFGPRSAPMQGPDGLVKTGSRGSNPTSPVSVYGHAHHHSVVHTFLPGPSRSGGHKRTPNTKSLGATTAMGDASSNGASSSTLASISASASTSDSDPFSPSGPVLGRLLRGPLRNGKVVFGKELKTVVKDTMVVIQEENPNGSIKEGLIKELEERAVPALVVRCAQHLLIWGVQEEGLFRVNGRPRHVSRLRAEFDAGVDYDMTECSPSDLDPHAVASVFKAYLRELPDSILTQKLQPYFDAAIYKENSVITAEQMSIPQLSSKSGKGLPSNPKGGFSISSLRKPPSLSTLAMPTFNQVPSPSKSLVTAFRSLIVQLPPENRDLLRTVVDLIRATAQGSKATKMPLSNLLLVFCPSLNMSPPLLRVLCEIDGLWIEEDKIIDIKRKAEAHEELVDSDDDLPPPTPEKDRVVNITRVDVENDDLETRSRLDDESSLLSSDNLSSLDYHASAEDSSISEERPALPRRRKEVLDRSEIPTVYLDSKSYLSSTSSVASFQDPLEACQQDGQFALQHDLRDDGSISSDLSLNNNLRRSHSPPPLSTSAESVSTPTSSVNPSFSHLPLDGTEMAKDIDQQRNDDLPSVRTSPQIVGSEPMVSRRRPLISHPIPITGPMQFPFPTTLTRDPSASPTLSKRRSIPLLSLSSLSSQSSNSPRNRDYGSPSGSPAQAEFRSKRPSLRLLFSKKSTPSLFEDKERVITGGNFSSSQASQSLQDRSSSRTGSDSSISTPISAVTAPQTTSSGMVSVSSILKDLPPVLNTLIEDSSFRIDDFLGADPKSLSNTKLSGSKDDSPRSDESESLPPLPDSTHSTPSQECHSHSSKKPVLKAMTLPVEPLVISPRSAKRSDAQLFPQRRPRLQPSTASLSLLELSPNNSIDKKDEDWMRSVLIAADVGGDFSSGSKS